MTAEQRPEEVLEPVADGFEQEAGGQAPSGACPPAEPAESAGAGEPLRTGHEQRKRAGAAAAYAAVQSQAPQPSAAATAEPEQADSPAPAAEQTQAESATAAAGEQDERGEATEEDDAGRQVALDLEELAAKAELADEYLALAQRTQADFDNYRKRAMREAGLAQDRGVAKLVKELLPAIDNLDRALQAAGDEQSALAEGIRFVHSDLLAALARVGVEPFSPAGEPFDPQLHEAVAQQPVEGVEAGTVAEVFQQGFRLGDSVLRPARVLVAA